MKKNRLLVHYLLSALLIFSVSIQAQNQADKYDLLLKFGNMNVVENSTQYIQNFDKQKEVVYQGYFHKIIQFYELPDQQDKNFLKQSGIKIIDYIPNNAFLVAIPGGYDLNLLSNKNIRSFVNITPEIKQDPYILDKNYPEWALRSNNQIDIMITGYGNLTTQQVSENLNTYIKGILQVDEISNSQIVTVNISDLDRIIASPVVQFIEPVYPPGEPENYTGKTLHRSNVLDSDYPTGRHYDGEGVNVMLQDDGVIGPHIDYEGRIGDQFITSNSGDHGDHCAGTIFGAGNIDPTTAGQAPGATLYVYGAAPTYPGFSSIPSHYSSYDIRISSTSYSNGCNAGYTSLARTMDLHINQYESLMHVFSAGNAGGDNCGYGAGAGWGNVTGGHKIGKNVIAVANLGYTSNLAGSSSRGPAHDGRIKPDISAKGSDVYSTTNPNDYTTKSGTSMSCPGVSGSMAQLYQAYRDLNSNNDPKGGFMKGLILNTADDLGNVGPDFKYGWGQINNRRAVELLEEERYMTDEINQGETNQHTIPVPADVKQLKVMVYWTDKEANINASVALVNNLDIILTDPSNNDHMPWLLSHYPNADSLNKPAATGVDNLNNVEQVSIMDPASGNFTLTIDGTAVPFGPQEYYVYYEYLYDEIVVTYPQGGESFKPGETVVVRWDAFGEDAPFTVEYSLDDGANWTTVNSNINASQRHFNWSPPDEVTSKGKIRILKGSISGESIEGFSLIGIPDDFWFERACPESVLVKWETVDGADSYDVFMLGDEYMEVVGSTSADSLLVEGLSFEEEYWFSVRAVGPDDAIGRRAIAKMKEPGVWNCLFSKDLALNDILSPPIGVIFGCQDYSNLNVVVEVKNFGAEPMEDVTVYYQFEGGAEMSEVIAGPIEPGETLNYEFSSSVSISSNGIYDISAWLEVDGDENEANDIFSGVSKMKSAQYLGTNDLATFDEFDACSFAPDCGDISCYIDNKWYNFQNGLNDDIDWRLLNGITPTPNTGPTGDHTTGTLEGNFLYLEASGECYEKQAILTTPCINISALSNPGMIFYFSMNGDDMGSLHVDVIADGVLNKDVIPALSGDWGPDWVEGHIYFADFMDTDNLNVRFRAYTGDGEQSDIAIDDIILTSMTGISENQKNKQVRVYPNPGQGTINLTSSMDIKNAKIQIVNTMGGKVYEQDINMLNRGDVYSMNIDVEAGIYYLILDDQQGNIINEKIIIQ